MFDVVTDNFYLFYGMSFILKDIVALSRCRAKTLIIDSSSRDFISYMKNRNHFDICCLVLITHNGNISELYRMINYPYPVVFIEMTSSLCGIISQVNKLTASLISRDICQGYQQISIKNFVAIRFMEDAFFEKEILNGEKKQINKELINYHRKAIKKNGMTLSVHNYRALGNYLVLKKILSSALLKDNDSCLLRFVYIKSNTSLSVYEPEVNIKIP